MDRLFDWIDDSRWHYVLAINAYGVGAAVLLGLIGLLGGIDDGMGAALGAYVGVLFSGFVILPLLDKLFRRWD